MLKFAKVRNVKSPVRAHETDAGIDFFVPNDFNNGEKFVLYEQDRVLIPSGIHMNIPDGYALIMFNKSGVSSKLGLDVLACVVGETIVLTNKGKFSVKTLTPSFVKENNLKILAYNEKTKLTEYCKFDGFRTTGKKKCIKLIFDTGDEIICSEDHFILTNNGWKKAIDIDNNDEINFNV